MFKLGKAKTGSKDQPNNLTKKIKTMLRMLMRLNSECLPKKLPKLKELKVRPNTLVMKMAKELSTKVDPIITMF